MGIGTDDGFFCGEDDGFCTCACTCARERLGERKRKKREKTESKEGKKKDTYNPKEGWEDGTPPAHRDFTGRKVCC